MLTKFIIFTIFLCILYTNCEWTTPVKVQEMAHYMEIYVTSTFRDTKNKITHTIVADRFAREYYYLAIDDNGKILYRTNILGQEFIFTGLISGPDNGKNLYMLLWGKPSPTAESFTISYSESEDNGLTWSEFKVIVKEEGFHKLLQDMIYVKETNRIYAFFNGEDKTVRMITKPNNSSIFSSESIIAKNAFVDALIIKAAYSPHKTGHGIRLHVFYKNTNQNLVYITSENSGVHWSSPYVFPDEAVKSVSGVVATQNSVYAVYTPLESNPAKLVFSHDFGKTFKTINVMTDPVVSYTIQGFTMCQNKNNIFLAGLFVADTDNDFVCEYDLIKANDMKPLRKDNPFKEEKIISSIMLCDTDNDRNEANLISFVVREDHVIQKTLVLYAKNTEKFDNLIKVN